MRTQFFFVGLLSGVAGVLVGTAGCDNITAGQSADTSAPPQLVHVMIQDARYFVWRSRTAARRSTSSTTTPTRACTIHARQCRRRRRIPAARHLHQRVPRRPARSRRPLPRRGRLQRPAQDPGDGRAGSASADAPRRRDPTCAIRAAASQIRLVFDKVLDNSIETVMMDPTKAPGSTNTYTIMPGHRRARRRGRQARRERHLLRQRRLAAVLGRPRAGSARPGHRHQAEGARSTPATKYTVKILNPGALKDREGNAAVGLGGGALPTTLTFTTEDLTPANAGNFPSDAAGGNGFDYPDFTARRCRPSRRTRSSRSASSRPSPATSATVTVKSGCTGAKPIAYSERGNDATMCTEGRDPGGYPVLDIINSDTGDIDDGVPGPSWPRGRLHAAHQRSRTSTASSTFEADSRSRSSRTDETTDPMVDPNIESQHVTPAAMHDAVIRA